MIKASAPGKMILIGEYAVLEGAPALVCAVNRRAQVSIQPRSGNEFSLNSPTLDIPAQHFVLSSGSRVRFDPRLETGIARRLVFFQSLFESALEYISSNNLRLPVCGIDLDTSAFYSGRFHAKYGFGSSAALTVALLGAMLKAAGGRPDSGELYKEALRMHHRAQGNLGSGIDIAASTYGGVLIFRRSRENSGLKIPERVEHWPQLHILPVWSGHSASTKKMVSGVNMLRQTKAELFDELIHRLTEISTAGCAAYKEKNARAFLKSVELYYEALLLLGQNSGMPIISDRHRQIHDLVQNAGAFYKPSGAGSGDIGLAISDDASIIRQVKQALQEKDIYSLDVSVDELGLDFK